MSTAHPFVLGFGTANESHETRGSGVGELTPARLVSEGYTPDAISGRCGLVEGPFSCRPCRTLTVRFVLKDTTPFFFNATLLLCFPHRAGNKWIGK